MKSTLLVLAGLTLVVGIGWAAVSSAQQGVLEQAVALHRETPLIDGHNDIPWKFREKANRDLSKMDLRQRQPELHTDIPRLRQGGVGGEFWSVYVPVTMQGSEAVRATMEQIDFVYQMMDRYPDTFELARTAADVERVFKAGKIASLIGMEGGHSIDNSLATLRMFYKLGARYMTLTHSSNTAWADSATDQPKSGGLTPFGEGVVREMNWLGMMVDLSHVSPDTMSDALQVTQAPVIFSHSSARAVIDHPRNVPDIILAKIPANGGVVMVNFVPGFISEEVREYEALPQNQRQNQPAPRASMAQVADHIDHIRKVAGINSIGLGSDFDGIATVPQNLEDVSKFPVLTAELLRRGYTKDDLRKILGQNVLRVMRQVEQVAARLQKERPASTMVFAGPN
ncbi:MAG TPA: dipeptidase [Terriglobia bacterium]|nr:dipeptidase [Terriglobia bacterium]